MPWMMYLEAGAVDLLSELVDGDVGGSTDEHRTPRLLDQVVHHRGRGDRLTRPRGTLRRQGAERQINYQ